MMVLSSLRPDASLAEFLAYRARSAPIIRLVAEAIGSLAPLAAALWWNPRAQLLIVTAAGCVFCYAAWGLLDRARSHAVERGRTRFARVMHASCVLIAAVGACAGAGVLLSLWAMALGTWIS